VRAWDSTTSSDKAALFLFKFHADDYKSLRQPAILRAVTNQMIFLAHTNGIGLLCREYGFEAAGAKKMVPVLERLTVS
jgi:hypothetical protein